VKHLGLGEKCKALHRKDTSRADVTRKNSKRCTTRIPFPVSSASTHDIGVKFEFEQESLQTFGSMG
jgi:Sec7-like guanine-nucleotide exchange factor